MAQFVLGTFLAISILYALSHVAHGERRLYDCREPDPPEPEGFPVLLKGDQDDCGPPSG